MDETKLHAAIIVSPGTGHLIPALLLANRFTTHHNVRVTILVASTHSSPAESQLLLPFTSSDHLDIIKIPLPDISPLVEPDVRVGTRLAVMMREARSGIRSAISALSSRPDVLIADLFATEAWPIAEEFGMARYVYVTSTAWFTALTAYCCVLDVEVKGQYVDQKEPLRIPGCKPVRPEDVVDPMLDRNNQDYHEYVRMGLDFSRYDGVLLNIWEDLERKTVNALRQKGVLKVPVYPIGPLSRPVEQDDSPNENIIEWLEMQPSESVIYVSFGSGGTLSAEQIMELASGLERSQQRFVWMVRPPAAATGDSFFTAGMETGTSTASAYFPDGFLERTHKRVGLIVSGWAPQVRILNHRSVGGFLSHCGWNSTLESIASGVPMIAWPLYSEQKLNATMLAEELEIAVRPAALPTEKVVRREEVEKMVRTLMEGEQGTEMRDKVKKLKESGEAALGIGGSSYNSLSEIVKNSTSRFKKNIIIS